jgi:hypothetical protein
MDFWGHGLHTVYYKCGCINSKWMTGNGERFSVQTFPIQQGWKNLKVHYHGNSGFNMMTVFTKKKSNIFYSLFNRVENYITIIGVLKGASVSYLEKSLGWIRRLLSCVLLWWRQMCTYTANSSVFLCVCYYQDTFNFHYSTLRKLKPPALDGSSGLQISLT